jgi:metal-responsive CopG/Arc/MetJ family transcriptional regulator
MRRKQTDQRKIPVLIYLPHETLEDLDEILENMETSRSDLIHFLVKLGLAQLKDRVRGSETSVV